MGDLLVEQAFRDKLQHFALPLRKILNNRNRAHPPWLGKTRGIAVNFHLRAEKIFQLALFVKQRRDQHGILKGRAIFLVIQDLDQNGFPLAHPAPDFLGQPGFGRLASQKAAVATDDEVPVITGQIGLLSISAITDGFGKSDREIAIWFCSL